MPRNPITSMPRAVQRRIMERAAAGARHLVVVIKKGRPARVYRLEQYLQRVELTKATKPWERRRPKSAAPDPLGAVDGEVLAPLTRKQMYE